MALNHTHQAFPNFVLENTIEDQYNSHLDLMRFCTVDNSLVGVAGDIKKIRVYSASNGTEKLAMGDGNTKNIEVAYADKEYVILLAQNRFPYYDEELMRELPVAGKHLNATVPAENIEIFHEKYIEITKKKRHRRASELNQI